MVETIKTFKKFIDLGLAVLVPTILVIFTLTVVVGLSRWAYKKREQLSEVSKSPLLLIVWIILAIAVVVVYLIYIKPILRF